MRNMYEWAFVLHWIIHYQQTQRTVQENEWDSCNKQNKQLQQSEWTSIRSEITWITNSRQLHKSCRKCKFENKTKRASGYTTGAIRYLEGGVSTICQHFDYVLHIVNFTILYSYPPCALIPVQINGVKISVSRTA
jgi:hypothetical protein